MNGEVVTVRVQCLECCRINARPIYLAYAMLDAHSNVFISQMKNSTITISVFRGCILVFDDSDLSRHPFGIEAISSTILEFVPQYW